MTFAENLILDLLKFILINMEHILLDRTEGGFIMRPIDADAVHTTISYAFSDGHDDLNGQLFGNMIDEMPTISQDDIIKHGRWELIDKDPRDFCSGTEWRCSECGDTIYLVHNNPEGYNYCSHCGAKMDTYIDPHMPNIFDMERIRLYTKKPINPEDAFVFEVKLATNEVDKDNEYFSPECLWSMGSLFLGKKGISRTNQSYKGAPIIFDTRIEENDTVKTRSGNYAMTLYAKAFMLRTEENEQTIADIEKGKLSQVSVSISVQSHVCNICGQPICTHKIGKTYNGKVCYRALCGAQEAYEWAFVEPAKTIIKVRRKM